MSHLILQFLAVHVRSLAGDLLLAGNPDLLLHARHTLGLVVQWC
jgi:hypothetical protein